MFLDKIYIVLYVLYHYLKLACIYVLPFVVGFFILDFTLYVKFNRSFYQAIKKEYRKIIDKI